MSLPSAERCLEAAIAGQNVDDCPPPRGRPLADYRDPGVNAGIPPLFIVPDVSAREANARRR